jgi:hypothetical protein
MRLASTHARLATACANTGKIAPAREECAKAEKILSASRDDVVNTMAARVRTIGYGDLGEAYAALAATEARPADWHAARDTYQRDLELLQDLQRRGILGEDEIPEIENTKHKIAQCDAALAEKSNLPVR